MAENRKKCFVIAPIGADGSKERQHSDDVLEFIINPVITTLGFEPGKRADHLGTPGDINRQVVERIVNDDLVIADLTGHNANVFYELAIRHAARKPCIHLIKAGERIPFDNSVQRTIFIDPEKIREVEKARKELAVQVTACMAPDFVVENPLSLTFNYERLNEGSPADRSIAVLLEQVEWLVSRERLRKSKEILEVVPHLTREALETMVEQRFRIVRPGLKVSKGMIDTALAEFQEAVVRKGISSTWDVFEIINVCVYEGVRRAEESAKLP